VDLNKFFCYFIDLHKTPPTRSPDQFGIGYSNPIGSIHIYHAVGGANCTTMVVMFVGLMWWG
jgi:hypothetical protein